MTTVLVTGGAGYIGSHACKTLKRLGMTPVAVDDLSTGWGEAAKFGPLERVDILDREALWGVFDRHRPAAVMHFAGKTLVGESMQDPGPYWTTNVGGTVNLIEAGLAHGCDKLVFSSTCAVYGDPNGKPLDEATPLGPVNTYGASKLAAEQVIESFVTSHALAAIRFRYFNVAGADPDAEVGEFHRPETHLIPKILDAAAGKDAAIKVFGTDYDTKDGTCVRDYVHVNDLIAAHVAGLKALLEGHGSAVYNLGTGTGFTVNEVIDACRKVTGRDIPVETAPRREGDPASLVSGSEKAERELGWRPDRSRIEIMVEDAWRWHRSGHYTE